VPEQIAALLGLPSITFAKEIHLEGETVKVQRLSDLGLDAAQVGAAGAGQEIVAVDEAPAREAGEIIEDDGEAFNKIVSFLDGLKVI
jgi:electron transfer flavoprotein beta subunit